MAHMAADPRVQAPWEAILDANIAGTYAVYEGARRAGVRRSIFASSNHATGYYEKEDVYTTPDMPVRPDSYYGVSKCFGEALGRYYVDAFGMSVICLRIGSFQPRPRGERQLATWISHRDTAQLVWRGIEADLPFGVFYGISGNTRAYWDIANARELLGYAPEDDAETYAREVLAGRARSWAAGAVAGGTPEPAPGPGPEPGAARRPAGPAAGVRPGQPAGHRHGLRPVLAYPGRLLRGGPAPGLPPGTGDSRAEVRPEIVLTRTVPGQEPKSRARPRGPLPSGAGRRAWPGRSPGGAGCGCARGRSAGGRPSPCSWSRRGRTSGRDATPRVRAAVRSGARRHSLCLNGLLGDRA